MATSLTNTTLAAALTTSADVCKLTSASGVAVGNFLYVDHECLFVTAINGVYISIRRGVAGTAASAHISGARIWTGTPDQIYACDPPSASAAAAVSVTPWINQYTGDHFVLDDTLQFRKVADAGIYAALPSGFVRKYTTAGAISIEAGLHELNTGAASSMTLAEPTGLPEGATLTIAAKDAYAYTVTLSSGFYGNTTSSDVATFAGTIGASMTINVVNGKWNVVSLTGVTLG